MNRDMKLIMALMVLCAIGSIVAVVVFAANIRAIRLDLTEMHSQMVAAAAGALTVVGSASCILLISPAPAKWSIRWQIRYARALTAAAAISWVALLVMTSLCMGAALFFGAAFAAMCLMNSKSTLLIAWDGKAGRDKKQG